MPIMTAINPTADKNSEDYGYGFDCVVGLGSINATELMNYILKVHLLH